MIFPQVICYFIIIAAGTTVYTSGLHDIGAPTRAAQTLKPFGSGRGIILFSIGLLGTDLLGVPTLAGSVAYVLNAAAGWPSPGSCPSRRHVDGRAGCAGAGDGHQYQ